MARRKVHCFWCGEDLGEMDSHDAGDYPTCGRRECEREAHYQHQADQGAREARAREDDYRRY